MLYFRGFKAIIALTSRHYIEVPYLYYRGYLAKDTLMEETLHICPSENNLIKILVPPEYEGNLNVFFYIRKIWRVSEIISLAMALGIICC